MSEAWRQLLYPLGFLSSIAFTARFLNQWIVSEQQKKSVVTSMFWKLSLLGNILLFIHSFIQIQFHVCFVQACNAVISWRNLNLMQPAQQQWKLSSTILLMLAGIAATVAGFILQSHFVHDSYQDWFRSPISRWSNPEQSSVNNWWHAAGFLGLILFNSRFWIQWWGAEKLHKSYLGPVFWWMSLAGAVLCMIYFLRIMDLINLVGPLFGLIPYVRNLMILHKSKQSA